MEDIGVNVTIIINVSKIFLLSISDFLFCFVLMSFPFLTSSFFFLLLHDGYRSLTTLTRLFIPKLVEANLMEHLWLAWMCT